MTDDILLHALKKLNSVAPTMEERVRMKERVFSEIAREPTLPLSSSFRAYRRLHKNYLATITSVAMMTLVVVALVTGGTFTTLSPSMRLALAHDAYHRSRISVDILDVSVRTFEHNPSSDTAREVTELVGRTLDTLGTLRLVGEPGKYTQQECLSAYKSFDTTLDELKGGLSQRILAERDIHVRETFERSRSAVIDALREVKGRIDKYPEELHQ